MQGYGGYGLPLSHGKKKKQKTVQAPENWKGEAFQ